MFIELVRVNLLKFSISAIIKPKSYLFDTTTETLLNTNTVSETNALPVITSNIERGLEV
jgi:hypothetical protein